MLVGVDGSEQSRTASMIAVLIGESLDVPVQAVHVRDRTYSRAVADAMLDRSVGDLPGSRPIGRSVIEAAVVGHGIASRSSASDIVILGSSKQTRLGNLMSTDTAELVFRRSNATVIVVSERAGDDRSVPARVLARLRALRPQLTRLERDTVVWSSAAAAPLSTDFIILLAVSALLASFGLLQNSAAVVIGAMLVAPLLGPLAAASTGLVTARLALSARALLTLLVGTVATIAVAIAAGLLIPIASPTSEMIARGSPTLIDLGVAMAAGVVGAYATARKDIPAALAGVAIAAALVPPLCTTGLALAFGDLGLAYGSFLLFTTNIVSVIVVGGLVLRWMGMRPSSEDPGGLALWGMAIIVVLLAFVTVVVGLRSFQGARQAQFAADDLADLFPSGDVIDVSSRSTSPVIVTATVRTAVDVTADDVAEIESRLEQRLGVDIQLEVVVERVVVSNGP
ncbi:MAG TPA: TIGR00341 family protein [Acidimicrobiia bacterium]